MVQPANPTCSTTAAAPFGRLLYHCDGTWSDEPFELMASHAEA